MPSNLLTVGCLQAALLTALFVCRPVMADLVSDVHGLLAKGDQTAALRVADAAVEANPREAQARFLQAVVLMDLQRSEDALVAFTRLAQEYPELPEPYNNIALLQVRAGRLELARQALENALRNDPGHRAARANLGEVHLMLAVQAWQQAARGAPLDARLQRKLDAARALLGIGASTGASPGGSSGSLPAASPAR